MDYTTAEKLIWLRKEHGLSREELANKLNVSRQEVSKWEHGEYLPTTETLMTLSELYDIPLDELVSDDTLEIDEEQVDDAEVATYSKTAHLIDKIRESKTTLLVLSLIGFVVSILCMLLIGYLFSEVLGIIVEQYESIDQDQLDSEIAGYAAALGFSIIGFAISIIFGIVFLRKYKKSMKPNTKYKRQPS